MNSEFGCCTEENTIFYHLVPVSSLKPVEHGVIMQAASRLSGNIAPVVTRAHIVYCGNFSYFGHF